MPKIFISHSTKDAETIVKPFIEMLVMGLDIARRDIYSTSDHDIPTGEDFPNHIKTNIQSTELVVMILTENYMNSHFCLNEMGAAWANNSKIYPIVIPPATYEILQSSALRGVTNVLTVSTEQDIQKLRDEFDFKGLTGTVRSTDLISRGRIFLEHIEKEKVRIEKAGFQSVDIELYKKMRLELKEALDSNLEKTKELDEKDKLIEALQKAKDPTEVKEIIQEDMPMWDKLLEQVEKIKDVISDYRLDWKSVSLIYHDLVFDQPFLPRETMGWSPINELIAEQIAYNEEGVYLNRANYKVKAVLSEIKQFQLLTEDCSDDIHKRFIEEFGVDYDITHVDFWKKVLNQQAIELSQ
ncbi:MULTISPECIES: toll/interleukin-1 receptor domain-containing protein [Bacillus]|uniref:toll/interleukin-1 receptor domain-containing protein n=1 Tax=Bacillus TaxID=1386 RepID=UPI0012FBFDD5|nr:MULTISPECIES: toll/interleukin-1 receptor domain-containing protein [Bacillus]NOL32137.1 toll/interleukin-1 receptor domain-containing protein [Bacillus altitudinis]QGX66433.1 TIR domain-containing protein [Bacillus sp. ms-22]